MEQPEKTKASPTPPTSAGEVSIIAADAGIGELLVELLENQFQVKSFASLAEFERSFLAKNREISPDLVLCDAKLRDASGIDALKRIRKVDPQIPIILMVTQPDKQWTEEAFRAGVTDLLEKPFESFLFIDKFRGRIAQARLHRAQDRMTELLRTQLLLTTTQANRLFDQIAKDAKSVPKKLRYADPDEDAIRFGHARKSAEKLLHEIEQCRIEYLALAEKLRIS
ncbi:MAG: response regulator [Bdellovibrionales bacterium]|nr:response regulator [Bdellovibrionales bacterium]